MNMKNAKQLFLNKHYFTNKQFENYSDNCFIFFLNELKKSKEIILYIIKTFYIYLKLNYVNLDFIYLFIFNYNRIEEK